MLIVIDLNHVAYRCLFATKKDILDVGWKYFKHVMYNQIFSMCKKFEATKVILAVDSKDNWRKKVYSEYKENRKESRDAHDDINWNEFFKAYQEFIDEVKTNFPFYVLQIKYLEGDDIAGIIAKYYQNEQKVIISSDSDYIQLLRYNNIKIYDPMKMAYVKCEDPEKQLKAKIIMGDKGDNIKAIKPKIGKVKAQKLVENVELLDELFNDKTVSYTKQDGTEVTFGDECKLNYKRNTILIDLDKIPDVFCQKVQNDIKQYNLPTGKTIAQYLIKNEYRELVRRLEEIDQILKRIVTAKKQEEQFEEMIK
jgi:5'-3' exonuclease